jgi:uncharacterized protein (UPF0333 family)
MNGRRAQVSIEYLMIVAFAFVLLMPLIVIYYQSQNDMTVKIISVQVDRIANEIVDAADEVYYLGPPTQKTLKVYMPDGVNAIVIENNYILFTTTQLQGAPRYSVANLSGSLTETSGLHIITLTALDTGVEITDE